MIIGIGINRISGITGMLEYNYFRQYLNNLDNINPYNTRIDIPHNFTQEELIEALKALEKSMNTIIIKKD
jgi:hypothetical protein